MVDSKTWVHIDITWLKFVAKPNHVPLALVIDGSNRWSFWLVLLFNYNLPPWLTTKTFFVMLGLIIPSLEFIRMHDIDVYMALLIEELQELWKGLQHGMWQRLKGKGSFIYEQF